MAGDRPFSSSFELGPQFCVRAWVSVHMGSFDQRHRFGLGDGNASEWTVLGHFQFIYIAATTQAARKEDIGEIFRAPGVLCGLWALQEICTVSTSFVFIFTTCSFTRLAPRSKCRVHAHLGGRRCYRWGFMDVCTRSKRSRSSFTFSESWRSCSCWPSCSCSPRRPHGDWSWSGNWRSKQLLWIRGPWATTGDEAFYNGVLHGQRPHALSAKMVHIWGPAQGHHSLFFPGRTWHCSSSRCRTTSGRSADGKRAPSDCSATARRHWRLHFPTGSSWRGLSQCLSFPRSGDRQKSQTASSDHLQEGSHCGIGTAAILHLRKKDLPSVAQSAPGQNAKRSASWPQTWRLREACSSPRSRWSTSTVHERCGTVHAERISS